MVEIGIVLAAGILYLSQLYVIARVQYTIVAIFLAMAGFIGFFLYRNRKTKWIVFCVLELLAYLLREQAMLMVVPMGMAMMAGILLLEKDRAWKEKGIEFLKSVCILLAVLTVGFLGNLVSYRGTEWKEFKEFNEARTAIFDYAAMPSYEEVKSILDKYHVDRTEYEAFSAYTFLWGKIDAKCLTEIADYVKASTIAPGWTEVKEELDEFLWGNGNWLLGDVLIAMWLCALLWAILPGNRKMLLPLAGLWGASLTILTYLIWRGRFPLHVKLPFILCILYFLTALVWKYTSENRNRKKWYGFILLILGVVCLHKAYLSGQRQYRDLLPRSQTEEIYIEGLREMVSYCNERQEQKFLVETFTVAYYTGNVLETDLYQQERNCRITGGWFFNAPCYVESLNDYLGDVQDGLYLILSYSDTILEKPMVAYIEEKLDCQAETVDFLAASHGGLYAILYFEKNCDIIE